jgi:hypothetical protein
MKILALLLLAMPAYALSNAVTIHSAGAEVPASQVHRVPRWFAQGEITGQPRPFVGGIAAGAWQADVKNRWPDGSVQYAIISFPAAIPAAGSVTVEFRDSPDACHLGNQAVCEAAALGSQGMLDFSGGTWAAVIEVQAEPAGETTLRSANARTMIANGHFTYWLRGPVVTEVIVEDASLARQYDFGWVCSASCSQPYASTTWTDDPTYRSLHPIFVLSFATGMSTVRAQYTLANYWTTARQDQRYSLTLKTGAGTVFSKAVVRAPGGTWWRKEYYDGAAPVQTRTDFNLEYLRYSTMVMPFKTGITVNATGPISVASSISWFQQGAADEFPFWCPNTNPNSQCGSRLRTYSATGGRPDRGFYPLWEAQWLHSMDAGLYDVVRANADYVGVQQIHWRESATGLDYLPDVDIHGFPVSLNARDNLWHNGGINWTGVPAAVAALQSNYSYWYPDNAHMHSHAQLAYLVTGDWWYMQEQAFLGHYIFGWAQKDGANHAGRKGNWGYIKPNEANHRAMAWMMWNLWRASLIIPDGDPQKTYLREKLTDQVATLEGYWNITDGDHYEPCTTNPFAPYDEESRWCWGRFVPGFAMKYPLNLSEARGGTSTTVNLNTSLVKRGASPWIDNFVALGIFDMCRTSGIGCPLARYHATKQAMLATSTSGAHGRMMIWYNQSVLKHKSTTLTQDLASNGLTMHVADASVCTEPPTWLTVGSEHILTFGRDLENNTLAIGAGARGGRHYNDGAAASNHTAGAAVYCNDQFDSFEEMYSTLTAFDGNYDAKVLIRGASDMVGDVYPSQQCAAGIWSEDFSISKRAGEVWEANCHENEAGGTAAYYSVQSDPRWYLFPDRLVRQVRVIVGGGAATLRYVAPTGAPCRVYLGSTPPESSDDSVDQTDTPRGRQHSYTADGLLPGEYRYRISCGTVRAQGSFAVQ